MSKVDVDTVASPLPTSRGIPIRHGDFETLCDALDYAATGNTGFNYFDGKARLKSSLSYAELRSQAIDMAPANMQVWSQLRFLYPLR